MELADAVRGRRMTRAFERRAVPSEVLDEVLDLAVRVPSAGNTRGLDLVVLEGEQTARYWEAALPADRRAGFPWPRLLDAPVLVDPGRRPRCLHGPLRRAGQGPHRAGGGRGPLGGPVLVRRHRLLRHGRPAGGPRRRVWGRCSSGSSSTPRR